ncbi:MAG: CbiX/SirB N-terminal domain-containing protein [Nitrospirae bacterium]|nr:CbiX/SirB N-terminal domain-containing protein [Nitrospirota bacterium]
MKALLLVIHGTRDPGGLSEIRSFVRGVRRKLKKIRVEFAFLAPGPNSLPTMAQRLRERGSKEIDVIPFLLFSGAHVRRDIPRMLSEIRLKNPDLTIRLGRHIGPSVEAVRIALTRWREMSRR